MSPTLKLKSDNPRQQRCRIELTDDGLDVGKTAHEWVQRDNVVPDAFVGLGPLQDNLAVAWNLIYFSFVTPTSVECGARTSSQARESG